MECYVCESEMEKIETIIISKDNHKRIWKCSVCGEEVIEIIK